MTATLLLVQRHVENVRFPLYDKSRFSLGFQRDRTDLPTLLYIEKYMTNLIDVEKIIDTFEE